MSPYMMKILKIQIEETNHDLLDSLDLKQIMDVVTHEDGHTLDHIVIPTVTNMQFTETEQLQNLWPLFYTHKNIFYKTASPKSHT